MLPSVACIVPTYGRQDLHGQLYTVFCAQVYEPKSLWIADDTPTGPSPFFASLRDPRVHYFWSPVRRTIGTKRNLLVEACDGDVIAHLDDDDFYHARYLPFMVQRLAGYDLIKLSVWDALSSYDNSVWRWDTTRSGGPCYEVTGGKAAVPIANCPSDPTAREAALYGYGFSYVYRRSVWQRQKFPDMNLGEDLTFVQSIRPWARIGLISNAPDLVLHVVHPKSTSLIYPQQCVSQCFNVLGEKPPKAPKAADKISLPVGSVAEVVALVKNTHSLPSLRERAAGVGLQVEHVEDGVDARVLKLPVPKTGYRYVRARVRALRDVLTRGSVPAPFSWRDASAVVTMKTS